MNQFGPSALINLSNFSSIKPEPASTPPQSSMANSTTVAKMPGTPSGGGRLSPESNQVIPPRVWDNRDDARASQVSQICLWLYLPCLNHQQKYNVY